MTLEFFPEGALGTSQATQAAIEAQTVEATYISPDRAKFSPGVAKAWCRITDVGALVAGSYNIASITDTAVGDRTVVFDVDFSNTNYAGFATLMNETGGAFNTSHALVGIAVGSIRHTIYNSTTLADQDTSVVFFGDQ